MSPQHGDVYLPYLRLVIFLDPCLEIVGSFCELSYSAQICGQWNLIRPAHFCSASPPSPDKQEGDHRKAKHGRHQSCNDQFPVGFSSPAAGIQPFVRLYAYW